jgi:hypothetical protein
MELAYSHSLNRFIFIWKIGFESVQFHEIHCTPRAPEFAPSRALFFDWFHLCSKKLNNL